MPETHPLPPGGGAPQGAGVCPFPLALDLRCPPCPPCRVFEIPTRRGLSFLSFRAYPRLTAPIRGKPRLTALVCAKTRQKFFGGPSAPDPRLRKPKRIRWQAPASNCVCSHQLAPTCAGKKFCQARKVWSPARNVPIRSGFRRSASFPNAY